MVLGHHQISTKLRSCLGDQAHNPSSPAHHAHNRAEAACPAGIDGIEGEIVDHPGRKA